ncbi:MAG: hypothetical protein LBC83_01130 [Oscillospiraceae bacterium]|jgi:hypothetical protein|nr:hypothetical protein [Oscillospiraceae bacterium]
MGEPIQVDFSDKTKKSGPKAPIIIPPERAGLRVLLSLAGTVLTALIGFFVLLPPINLHAQEFYYYIGLVLISFPVLLFIFSGTAKQPEYAPFVKKRSMLPLFAVAVVAVIFGVALAISSPLFQAKSYRDIMTEGARFEEAKFEERMLSADFSAIPKLDEDTARAAANRALGDMATTTGRVSQFTLAPTNTQINLGNKPYRVVTLAYASVIKWFTNTGEGLPGYVKVNMDDRNASFVESPIRYSDQEHFFKLLKRHLRFKFPTLMFGEANFEVDDSDKPWWVVPILTKKAGLLSGEDVTGIVIVDPDNGECTRYSMEQVREGKELQWIDRIYSAALLTKQYNFHGKYVNGFWNSFLGQNDVTITTNGYNYIAQDGDVWMYTGVTSATSDDSIVGFLMVNQRTRDTLYYRGSNVSGATEDSASAVANSLVSDLRWKASFPLLINVGAQPTYFVSLKNEDNNAVNAFAMVHVVNFSTVRAKGDTVLECLQAYVAAMKKAGLEVDDKKVNTNFNEAKQNEQQSTETPVGDEGETPKNIVKKGVIADIRSQNVDGTTVYYIQLQGETVYYSISAAAQEDVIFLANGANVVVTFLVEDPTAQILPVESVEKLQAEASVTPEMPQ